MIPRLAADHRLLCTDLREFGWSHAPRSWYGKRELADDVIALLDALSPDRVRLVGHVYRTFLARELPARARELRHGTIHGPDPARPLEPVLTEASLDGFSVTPTT